MRNPRRFGILLRTQSCQNGTWIHNSKMKVDDFMEEMYAMKVEKRNQIKAMSFPPISQDSSTLLEKLEACREQANKMSIRKKRSAAHRAQGENHSSENFVSNCYCFRMSTKSEQ